MSTQHYQTIYLSPHLDDAALSCGGQIYAQTAAGRAVLIITVMAGNPPATTLSEFADSLHQRWQLPADTVALRRAEDQAACRILGADCRHWQALDCIYRLHPATGEPMYTTREDLFGPVHAGDLHLIDWLAQKLAALPTHDRVVAPLTVGHHVDHQITRAAAERVFGANLLYYEDYPYAREPGALDAILPAKRTGWHAEVVPLRQEDLQAKIEAVATFASQISSFFDSHADLEQQVHEFARLVGGERLWRRL